MEKRLRIGFLQATNEIDVQWFRPLAFGYLKAYLQTHLDFPVDMEFLVKPEECVSFEVIGISSTSQAFTAAKELADSIRKTCEKALIILGGHHITYFPETLPDEFDLGVIGEGEETFLEIIRAFADGDSKITSERLRSIRGIAFRENGAIVRTPLRELIFPLDSIPFPTRSKDSAYLFSSRGCPYRCAFCSSSAFWKETRFFSADYVVREIEQLLKQFPDLHHIAIWDDLFVVNKPRFHDLVRLIEKKGINRKATFSFSVRANLVDDALCYALKRINVSATSFGAESGSNRVLKVLNKGTSVEMNQKALDTLRKHNIATKCSFIVGSPTETEEDVISTYEFIRRNVLDGKLDPASPVNILIPMPGTEMWAYATKTGKIDAKNIDWTRLSAYASYRSSTLTDFASWVAYRQMKNTIYLAEDTLPQDRLYELMSTNEGVLKSLEKGAELPIEDKMRRVGIDTIQVPGGLQRTARPTDQNGRNPGVTPIASASHAYCILGMHRSGTSAVARAVNLLGPYIGHREHLMPAVKGDNPDGFWEHISFFSLHERLLSHLSRSWDSILPLPHGWWRGADMHPYREELKRLIVSEFGDKDIWMWKDPRTSLLLPLWKDVMEELDIDIRYILCLRPPQDVADSLRRRNNFPEAKSLALWLLYSSSALFWTAGEKRVVIAFDDLLKDWEPPLRNIASSLAIPWPRDEAGLREGMNAFLRPRDGHSVSATESVSGGAGIGDPVKRLYGLLREAMENTEIMDSELFVRETEHIYRDYCAYAEMLLQGACGGKAAVSTAARVEEEGERKEEEGNPSGPSLEMFPLPDPVVGLSFPVFLLYKVSIIVPVWNQWEHSYRCLMSILEHTHDVPYEVIVVDNGSTDATEEIISKSDNIRVIRNSENRGYAQACNQASITARGEYLLFLNNDTQVTDGWLKAMVGLLDSDYTTGAVGAKLILPNGRLQEAGGIIWHDGSTSGYGRGEEPNDPRFSYVREVDYCSGACLLVRRDVFLHLAGFDEAYSPAYYEDADLCWGIKGLGYKVMYQPGSAVIHHEFGSGSRDRALALYKRNMPLFVSKWGNVLVDQYSLGEDDPLLARDSRKKERVLVVDWRDTMAAESDVGERSCDTAGFIAGIGYPTTFLTLLPRDALRSQADELQGRGVEVFFRDEVRIEDFLKERADFYQLLFFFSPGKSGGYIRAFREVFPASPAIFDASEMDGVGEWEMTGHNDLLMTHVDDVVVVPSEDMERALAGRGLHGVVVWEYLSHRNAEKDRRKDVFVLAGILRNALRGMSLRPRLAETGRNDRLVQEMRATISEMERYIGSLRETLPKKDEYIADLLKTLKEKGEYIADLSRALKERDKNLQSIGKKMFRWIRW